MTVNVGRPAARRRAPAASAAASAASRLTQVGDDGGELLHEHRADGDVGDAELVAAAAEHVGDLCG
jgi:hypothetical protein